jgi:hypothetical protein
MREEISLSWTIDPENLIKNKISADLSSVVLAWISWLRILIAPLIKLGDDNNSFVIIMAFDPEPLILNKGL